MPVQVDETHGCHEAKPGADLDCRALGTVAYLLAVFAYSISPVSYAGAVREVSVVFGALTGWWFLKERMGGIRVLGAVIIFTGILVIAIFG